MGFTRDALNSRPTALLTAVTGAIAAVFLSISLAACTTGAEQEPPSDNSSNQGTEAVVENLEEAVLGTWSSDEKGNPFLKFQEDGRLSGSDGCNGLGGEYTVDNESVTIKRGASTLMACPGVDDWLRNVTSVTVDGDTMTVFGKGGDEIGELQRDLSQDADESPESGD